MNKVDVFVQTKEQFDDLTKQFGVIEKDKPCSTDKKKTRIWLLRHAESQSNADKNDKSAVRIAGSLVDSPLGPNGPKQAREAGEILKANVQRVTVIFFSGMERTKKTAEEIGKVLDVNNFVKNFAVLREINYASLEGANGYKYDPEEDKMENTLPTLANFDARVEYRMVDGMENIKEVEARLHPFILSLARDFSGEDVVLVTHNAGLKALLMFAAHKNGFDLPYNRFNCENCSMELFETDGITFDLLAIKGFTFRPPKKQ